MTPEEKAINVVNEFYSHLTGTEKSAYKNGFYDGSIWQITQFNDFKSALRKEIEKAITDYRRIRSAWKQGTNNYEAYDLVLRVLDDQLKSLDTITPKK